VEYLVNLKADINAKTNDGKTPLRLAIEIASYNSEETKNKEIECC